MASTSSSGNQIKRQATRQVKRTVRGMNPGVLFLAVLFLVIGLAAGYYAAMTMTRDDCFVLRGESVITVPLNADYVYIDEGAKVVSVGRDLSSAVTVKTDLKTDSAGSYLIDTSTPTTYVLTYTVDDFKYGKIQRIRTITVAGGEN